MTPELQATIESLNLDYTATFVPFSKSRNAKPNPKVSDLKLNWEIRIAKGGRAIETDYSAGIGHIPGYKQSWGGRMSVDETEAIRRTCENGTIPLNSLGFHSKPIPAPKLADILYSLVSDASAIDYPRFEDWASDAGLNPDSRDAERIYRACLEIGLKLRAMLGDATLEQLRTAFQDY